jgi:hypothetical protein
VETVRSWVIELEAEEEIGRETEAEIVRSRVIE